MLTPQKWTCAEMALMLAPQNGSVRNGTEIGSPNMEMLRSGSGPKYGSLLFVGHLILENFTVGQVTVENSIHFHAFPAW
jgi:hypothetical protein